MHKNKIIVNLFVYNSYKNLHKIARSLYLSKLNIKKIFIIDNNSSNSLRERKTLLKQIKKLYNLKINLIVNSKNYGMGGSHKILFQLLKKEKFDYFVNLGTTNRYLISNVLADIKKNLLFEKDYYLFSRFLNKKNLTNYNYFRKVFNIAFVKLTQFYAKTYFSDPGSSTMIVKYHFFKKINKKEYINITNGSHFTHFFNINIYNLNLNLNFKEIPIIWREGNVKSHLRSVSYVVILFFSLIKFRINNKFFIEKNNKFKFKVYNF